MGDMALGKTFNCVHFTKIVLVFSEYHKKKSDRVFVGEVAEEGRMSPFVSSEIPN